MFAEQWNNRKRVRGEEEDISLPGFGEHRSKRRISTLPHRTSPNLNRHVSPPLVFCTNYASDPTPRTITPSDSETEDKPVVEEQKSVFSPYSSPENAVRQSLPAFPLDPLKGLRPDPPMYPDDSDMMDTTRLSPGPLHKDSPTSVSARIPTPIHSSFAPFNRPETASFHHDVDFADDEGIVERFRRGRRLPSPISESEISPSVIVDGIEGMQMEVDLSSQTDKETPTKKGHTRSKHSLRPWTGFGGEVGASGGMRKSFSMGYRTDCEKCRMKVPGHFSHIITN